MTGSDLVPEIIQKLFFLSSFADEIISTNLDENLDFISLTEI